MIQRAVAPRYKLGKIIRSEVPMPAGGIVRGSRPCLRAHMESYPVYMQYAARMDL